MSEPMTVSEITAILRETLEETFSRVKVVGEISNFTRAASGHLYFSLKDADALLGCACWAGSARRLKFQPAAGQQVVATGKISFYGPSGKCQLIVDDLQPVGAGAAEIAKQQLLAKLKSLGWFDRPRKELPRFPRRVALVTSATGAAVRDMIQSFAQRWPLCEIVVQHCRVQGETAPKEIAAGLNQLNVLHEGGELLLDAIIVGRGGGSTEDLDAFNQEIVAKAIYESRVPVVSAVGHEIDVTIADLVADARAETPSNAVTLITPNREELLAELSTSQVRLRQLLIGKVANIRRRLDLIAARPAFARPLDRIRRGEQRLDELSERLKTAMTRRMEWKKLKVAAIADRLQTLSPLNVLARGYSVTLTAEGNVIRSAKDAAPGDAITTRLAAGTVTSIVQETTP